MSNLALAESPKQGAIAATEVRALRLRSLALSYFRNYEQVRLELSDAPVVLTGHNGAGKTNILEAISLLTPGKGLRRAAIGELNNRNALPGEGWTVAASVSGMQGEVKIGTGRSAELSETHPDKRSVRIDGKPARSQAELGRHLAIIWLTPQMEHLFHESASAGRKFLDRLVYSFDPEHAARVNEYDYAMRERNRVLQTGYPDHTWCTALEQTMAETASAIAVARLQTVANIHHAIQGSDLSFPKAHIAVHGFAENRLQAGESALQVEDALKAYLAEHRWEDIKAGRSQTGAHRSHIQVIHTGKHMPAEHCSTGEQKALLLSIVLAQARAGALWQGVIPVLLLDEVVSHLDSVRRLELFEEICQIGAQTWMTGTDDSLFAGLKGKAQDFRVDNGRIGM